MRFINFLILITLCFSTIIAQEEYFENSFVDSSYYIKNSNSKEKHVKPERRIKPILSMGTSFSSFGSNHNIFSSYTKPGLVFNATPKLSISTGVMFVNSNYNFTNNEVDLSENSVLNTSMAYFYASGIYQVNTKLFVSGTVVKEINSGANKGFNNFNGNYNIKSGSIGFLYKINDNICLGAEFGFDNNYNPFRNNFYSPFHSPYYQPFGW